MIWVNQIHVGDCRVLMRRMISDGVKVQCIVTSPPYWGLRDYGMAGQFGLERTWVRHVARMRSVFRLVRELLAEDGVLWLNYGDSYHTPRPSGGVGYNSTINGKRSQEEFRKAARNLKSRICSPDVDGPNRRRQALLKPKDLVGMPWRIALALQADGWWLRSDVIWHKPNPMSESVTDRPTKSHEYVFMLTRSDRYFYDQAATREPASAGTHARMAQNVEAQIGSVRANGGKKANGPMKACVRGSSRKVGSRTDGVKSNESFNEALALLVPDRNLRTVWSIPTEGFSGAHFATFPRDLVRRCVLTASRTGDIVFDPFMGSGTVAQVADELGRKFIGCELNADYARMYGTVRPAQFGVPL